MDELEKKESKTEEKHGINTITNVYGREDYKKERVK